MRGCRESREPRSSTFFYVRKYYLPPLLNHLIGQHNSLICPKGTTMNRTKSTLAILTAATLAVGMTLSPMAVPKAEAQISFHLGWQQPPQEYNDFQRQGFHAGIEAAHEDLDHGLPPDPHRHWDFRRPHVPPGARDDFRRGFQHGYEMSYQHRSDWDRDHHDWHDHDGPR